MKVWNYIIIMVGIILVLHVLNLTPTGSSSVFNFTNIETNSTTGSMGTFTGISFSRSNFFDAIFSKTIILGILGGLALAGIAASLTGGRYSVENFIILPLITGILAGFVGVFLGIINDAVATGQTWSATIIVLILTPFMVGFVLALVEFFRGTD